MSLKSFQKFSKSALTGLGNKVAIQNFKRNLPKTEDAYPEELTFPEITDRETITNKMIMHVIKDDTSRAAMNVKEKLKELKTFSYVNDIKPKEVIETKNIAEEYNKRFQIKKVEGHKNSIRVGLLGYKVGMTGAWDKWGTWFPLTVIKVENCQVTQVKTKEGPDGYDALQVGVGQKDSTKMTKGMIGHYIKNDLSLKRHVREFRITPENNLPIGYMLSVRHFVPGQLVDVKGISKGKGWQGVMVRWNFGGGFATHGCSLKHRQTGSIGNREKPGKVWKNKKMAGQLGNEKIKSEHLRVYRIDYNRNLLFIKGSVPGNVEGLLKISDSIKKRLKQYQNLPFPTFVPEAGKEYPAVMEWTDTQDLNEKFTHDNDEVLGVSEEEEEGEPEAGENDESAAAMKK